MSEPLMTTDDVADRFQIAKRTVEYWRQTGDGPPYKKLGRFVRYCRTEVESWIEAATVAHTAEADAIG